MADSPKLSMFRRHQPDCPHFGKGRRLVKCACMIYVDGVIRGRRIRQSLNTVSWSVAQRLRDELEADLKRERTERKVPEAVAAFLEARSLDVAPSTLARYRRALGPLVAFAGAERIKTMRDFRLEDLDAFRRYRAVSSLTWTKELELLRAFWRFTVKRRWADENVAGEMQPPRNAKPRPRAPYTEEEIIKIFSAAERFGRRAYERLRAKAMLLLLYRYGLRVSDVATLERSRVKGGEIFLYTQKNGKPVKAPLYPDVAAALERVPLPEGVRPDCPYYFWTGKGSREGHIKTVDRTLKAVFEESGVEGAVSHRFRHTLAIKILVNGGTIVDAANILGDSPAVIERHYRQWCRQSQSRTIEALNRAHHAEFGSELAHFDDSPVSASFQKGNLVLEVGVEPTWPVKAAGF